MNKFIRAMLITFAVCLVCGGGLLIAGIALGGTWEDAVVTIGDDADDDDDFDLDDMFDHGLFRRHSSTQDTDDSEMTESVSVADEMNFAAMDIRDLKLTLRGCELHILPSDDDQIYVEIEGGKEKYFSVKQGKEHLSIVDTRKFKNHMEAFDVVLRIPEEHVFDSVDMTIGAGKVQIVRLAANQIDIEGGAGEIKAEMLVANKELDAEIGAGDFYIKEAVLGETDIECGVGKFEIGACTLSGDADINGGVGDVTIGIIGEKEDFNYELSCGMGELDVFGDSYTSLGREKEVDNRASFTISMECGVGKVSVYKAGDSPSGSNG